MFPQRNRGFQQPIPYSHNYNQMYHPHMMGYPQPQPPQGGGLFGRPRHGRYPGHPSQLSNQYYHPQQMPLHQQYQQQPPYPQYQQYQQQQQPPPQTSQSIFHDQNGNIDFKKIGGGVQSAIGLVNQVSPMMKMLGGFFIK
ncbi:YppG family protein [Bacillaceae bacterium IKA-2]|nr:YppG family protein [Bacillaceae bacterium IKA-2]